MKRSRPSAGRTDDEAIEEPREWGPSSSESDGLSRRGPRICLAASGGGHVRQLLDLEPVWSLHDYFFLTEETALGRSIASDHPTHFVAHYALGQSRLGNPLGMVTAAAKNLIESARIIFRERPDIIVTTGAGSVYFATLWGRFIGARVVFIESFARFDRPSMFGRLTAPIAHQKVIQSKALAHYWPDAKVFDPLKLLNGNRPAKKNLLFATVGATLPFDRLVRMVGELNAAGLIPEEILIQTGVGGLEPNGITTFESRPFNQIQETLRDADIVICHGGTGSIITALRQGCRVVAVPRLYELGEHYDNHQSEITTVFAARGLISVANTPQELAESLTVARTRKPILATTDPKELIAYLHELIARWAADRAYRGAKAA